MCILESVAAHLDSMELTVKHVAPRIFGRQTAARCVSVIQTAVVILSQVNAPVTQTAGVLFVSMSASVPAMVTVTLSMVTARVMKVGGHPPVLNPVSA